MSDMEDLAAQYGWNPEGEKTAEEYVKVALEKLPSQSKKIKQLFRAVEEMKDHMSKSEQAAYDRAKKELDVQRRQAIQDGDVEMVDKLDKEREQLLPQMAQTIHPAIQEFEDRNSEWLNGDSLDEMEMQQWVEAHGAVLGRKKLPPDEHMKLLEEHLHKRFPNYFNKGESVISAEENIMSPVISSRENVSSKSRITKKNITFNDLNEQQKRTARDFEQLGVMSIEQYIKDLKDHGEI